MMPRFQVYTCEYVEQGVRYTLTAPTAEEAVLCVLEGEIPHGVEWGVKIMGEGCKKMTFQWVEDEDGNDVTPARFHAQKLVAPELPYNGAMTPKELV